MTEMTLNLFQTDDKNPIYTTDAGCTEIGKIRVEGTPLIISFFSPGSLSWRKNLKFRTPIVLLAMRHETILGQ
jgi:hypothetical protein